MAAVAATASAVPIITIFSPAEDITLTNVPWVIIEANIDPVNATVTIDGDPVALDADGNFSFNTTLFEGSNQRTIRALDWEGNETVVPVWFLLDTSPPALTVWTPANQSLTNSTVAFVSGQTEGTATVEVQGVSVTVEPVYGNFSTTVVLDDLFDQTENLIAVRATDAAGNIAYENRTVIVDTKPPAIDLDLDPEVRSRIEAGLPVTFTTVIIRGTTDSSDAVVTVGGQELVLTGLSFSRPLVLREGDNLIEITATDLAGNVRRVTLLITRDTIAPSLVLATPAQSPVTTDQRTLLVSGYTDSEDAVVIVVYQNLRGEQVMEPLATSPEGLPVRYGFEYNLTLIADEALHVVLLRCVDLAGNYESLNFSYIATVSKPFLEVVGFETHVTEPFVWINGSTAPEILRLRINGQFFDMADGAFAVRFALPEESGTYAITVAVADDAGNVNTYTNEVTLELPTTEPPPPPPPAPQPPSVEIAPASHGALEVEAGHSAAFEVSFYGAVPHDLSIRWYFDGSLVGDGNRLELTDLVAGEHTLRLEVGNATWNVSRTQGIRVLEAEVHPAPPPEHVDIEGPTYEHLEHGGNATFEASFDHDLPADATVRWYLDGAVVGDGTRLELTDLSAGNHTLRVEASNATWSVSYDLPLDVRAALPPPVGSNVGYSLTPIGLALVVGLGAFGIFATKTEVGRYRIWWAIAAMVLGTKRPPSPLDHFLRGRLYQVISENPGIHYSDLRRRTGASNGAAAHHLHVLERAGLVRAVNDGTKTRFNTTEKPLDDETYGLSESDKAVLSTVEASPGLSQGELSERLDRSLSTVNRSVDRLAALGYVKTEHEGRTVTVFPRAVGGAPAGAIHILSGDE